MSAPPRGRIAGGGLVELVPQVLDPPEQREAVARGPLAEQGQDFVSAERHEIGGIVETLRNHAQVRAHAEAWGGGPITREGQRMLWPAREVVAAVRRTRRPVLGIEPGIGRAERELAEPNLAFRLEPLRPRAPDVVIRAEGPIGADSGRHPEAAHEADQVLGIAPERGQLEGQAGAIETDAEIVAAAALGLQRGIAEIRMELEQ